MRYYRTLYLCLPLSCPVESRTGPRMCTNLRGQARRCPQAGLWRMCTFRRRLQGKRETRVCDSWSLRFLLTNHRDENDLHTCLLPSCYLVNGHQTLPIIVHVKAECHVRFHVFYVFFDQNMGTVKTLTVQ